MQEPNPDSKLDMLDFEEKHPMPYEIALEIVHDCLKYVAMFANVRLGFTNNKAFNSKCYETVKAVFAASGIHYQESDYYTLLPILGRYEMARRLVEVGPSLGMTFPDKLHLINSKKKGNE